MSTKTLIEQINQKFSDWTEEQRGKLERGNTNIVMGKPSNHFLPFDNVPLRPGDNFFTMPKALISTQHGRFIRADNGDLFRVPMSVAYLLHDIPAGTRVNIKKLGIGTNTHFNVIDVDELPPPTRNVFLTNIVDEPKICRCPAINLLSTGHDAGCPEKKR